MLKKVSSRVGLRRFIRSSDLHTLSLQTPQLNGPSQLRNSARFRQKEVSKDDPKSLKQWKSFIEGLPAAYNAQLVEKSLLTRRTTLDAGMSNKILMTTGQRGSQEDVLRLRSLLSGPGRGRLTFAQDGLLRIVESSLRKVDFNDAVQWLLLAQQQVDFTPSPPTLRLLLKAASQHESWDVLYYIYGEMKRLDVALTAEEIKLIIRASKERPHRRWHFVFDLLSAGDQLAVETVTEGFQVLADAYQFSSIKVIFDRLSFSNAAIGLRDSVSLAVFPLGTAAIRTTDFSFLQQVLRFTSSDLVSASAVNWSVDRGDAPAVSVEEQSRWLLHFVDTLVAANSLKASTHVGLIVAWLLSAEKFDEAVSVWNKYVTVLTRQKVESLLDLEKDVGEAIDDVVDYFSRFSAHMPSSTHPSAAKFLRGVLLKGRSGASNPNAASPAAVMGANFSVRSSRAAHDMLALLAVTQDADAAATVLSRSLKAGHFVPEHAICTVLELLLTQKDYRLVLELAEVFISTMKGSEKARSLAVKKSGKSYVVPTVAAPSLYLPVLLANIEMGDIDGAVDLVSTTIPSQGYIPRTRFFSATIDALTETGQFERAVELYESAQLLYKDVTKRGFEIHSNTSRNYGVASPLLVHSVLASCAAGKLAVPAMEIFTSFEEAAGNGIVQASMANRLTFAEFVVQSAASEDFVQIIPQFLQSLGASRAPLRLSLELLVVSLAAAVTQQNVDVAKAVVAIIEQTQGRQVSDALSLQALVTTLRLKFDHNDEDGVQNFLLSVEELKNIK